jgi:MFS family permease
VPSACLPGGGELVTSSDTRTGPWLLPGQSRSLALLAAAQFVIAFDFTAVLIVLPQVGRELHAGATDLQWLVTAYAVALGGMLLLTGRLVDQRGRRRLFVAGHIVMAAGCGLGLGATTIWVLVAARVLVGIGAALLTPATVALLNATFQAESRNRALGVWGAAGAAGGVLGLVVGGFVANDLGWRAVFAVTGALCAASAVLGPCWLAADGPPTGRPATRDLLNGLLAMTAAVCLIWGLTDGAADPGRPWLPLALVCGGIFLCVVFVRRQSSGPDPLLPLWLFRTPSFRLAAVVAFLFHMSLNNQVYAMTLRLQGTFGFSTLAAGFLLVPNELAIVVGAHAGGAVVNRFGVRGPLVVAMMSGALGVLVYSVYWRSTPGLVILVAGLVISGLGQGVAWTAFWSTATQDVAPDRHGMASGLVSMTAQFGQALGIAALTVVALVVARFTADADAGLRIGQYVIVVLAALGSVAAALGAIRRSPP